MDRKGEKVGKILDVRAYPHCQWHLNNKNQSLPHNTKHMIVQKWKANKVSLYISEKGGKELGLLFSGGGEKQGYSLV